MQSLTIYEMRQEQRLVGLTHQHLGKTLEKQGELESAETEYRTAIEIERSLHDEVAASQCLTSLAELLLRGKRPEEAERAAKEALEYAQAGGDTQTQGQSLIALAQIRHQQGTYQEADRLFSQALEVLERSNSHEGAANAYFRYATLLEERGEVQLSLTAVKLAYNHQRRSTYGDLDEEREGVSRHDLQEQASV